MSTIRNVEFIDLRVPIEQPFSPAWESSVTYTSFPLGLVRIHTDEGCIGSAIELTPQHVMGASGSQLGFLRSLLIGADVFAVEPLMKKLRYAAFVGPRPWAIEVALWDAIGKLCGQPIFRLLGGSQRRVKAYASMLRLLPAEEQVREARQYFQQGFRAIKLRAHRPRIEEDLEVIRAVRSAVGSEMDIMVDANQAWNTEPPFWTTQSALRFARELEKLNVV